MPKVMRMARGASIAAVVVAALALGACANNKDLADVRPRCGNA